MPLLSTLQVRESFSASAAEVIVSAQAAAGITDIADEPPLCLSSIGRSVKVSTLLLWITLGCTLLLQGRARGGVPGHC